MKKNNLKSLNRVKSTGLNLSVKSIKQSCGHEGERLFSCVIYKDNKKVATFRELDWGGGSDVVAVNQKAESVLQEIKDVLLSTKLQMDITDEEYERLTDMEKFNKDWEFKAVEIDEWAYEACVYQELAKKAKRDIKKGYLSEDRTTFYIYSLPRTWTLEALQNSIRKENKGICLFDIKNEDEAINEYIKVFAEL